MSTHVTLIGRTDELDRLDRMLTESLSGNGRVALVSGPVGSGKTELIHTFAELASKVGVRFRKATCSPAERPLPLGVVSQLIGDTPPGMARLVERGLTALDPRVVEHAMVLHDVSRVVADLAEREPLLIGVDDLQHADAPSLDCLLYLARRISTSRVLIVLTESDQPRSPFHSALLRERHCRRIRLGTLSRREIISLAGPLAEEVHRLSGGNPLLAHALLEDHETTGELGGPAFREDLLACLHRSDDSVSALAAGLAVLGADASPALLSQVTGVDVTAVPRALRAMEMAGLVEDGWFRHPAAASVVLDGLSWQHRGELHLKAARLLQDLGAPAVDIARHLAATDRPLGAWAAVVLREAAEQAVRDGDIDLAVRHLELAVRSGADERHRASLRSRLAWVEWRSSPATATRHFPALQAAAHEGLLGPWDTVALVRQMLWHGRFTEASDALERLRASGAMPRSVELWLACTYPRLARRAGPPSATLTSAPWPRATTALAHVLTGRCSEEAVVTAEQILQGARAHGVSDYRVAALLTLVYADRVDVAVTWCDRLLAAASGRTLRAMLCSTRAEISVRQGDLREAARHAGTALTLLDHQSWGTNLGFPLSCALLSAVWSGRLDDAARLVELPVPEAMLESRAGVHYLYARGQHHLATGRHHAALADFLVIGEMLSSWRLDAPGLVPWRTGAAEAWLRQGKRDRARSLADEQLAIAGPDASRVRGMALRVLAACGEPQRRPPLLLEATEVLELCGDRFELARGLGELGRAHHALGDHRRARMVLRRAWHAAKECDALPLCRELIPNEDQHHHGGLSSLSSAERRVAALAANGHTNREIADKLFITASTVEQHLTRVYRKLNVKDRTDLPADMSA